LQHADARKSYTIPLFPTAATAAAALLQGLPQGRLLMYDPAIKETLVLAKVSFKVLPSK
jgi:hypothetical protein